MDPAVVGELIDRLAARLEVYAAQWVDSPADVVQDAFLQLVRQSVGPSDPEAWLFRVVRNRALSLAREKRRRLHREFEVASRWREQLAIPDDSLLDLELVLQQLDRLPDEQREVIVAHLWSGLSFVQIGGLMEISSSTAHRWYATGLAELKRKLGVPCPAN